MCVNVNPSYNPKFVDGKLTAWKVAYRYDHKYWRSMYKNHLIQKGWYQSDATQLTVSTELVSGRVEHGIHVCLNCIGVRLHLSGEPSYNVVVLECECYEKDYIACGTEEIDEVSFFYDAAFRQVKIIDEVSFMNFAPDSVMQHGYISLTNSYRKHLHIAPEYQGQLHAK